MSNRGIYGNAGLHKSYFKTNVFILKNTFLSKDLRRFLCNALIRLHFDYACAAWYPNLNKKYKNKLQVLRNKCICFWLEAHNREHIGMENFDKTKWLPKDKRFKQCFSTNFLKLSSKMCPQYMNEIYKTSNQNIF